MSDALQRDGVTAIRGAVLTFTGDPFLEDSTRCMRYESDAVVAMRGGLIVDFGTAADILPQLSPGTKVTSYADSLMMAGFIDAHVHYPQTSIVASPAAHLMDWLDRYTYAAEQQFSDRDHARDAARVFIRECLRAGTTTAAVFCTVHPESVDAFFEVALSHNMRMIAGKVLMDRNAPQKLTDTAQRGYDESKALIARWHGRGRLSYAVSPRFAVTSSHEQMDLAGSLWREHDGTFLQSHVAENRHEVDRVKALFPKCRGYLDVYDHHGMLGSRAIYGHGIWLAEDELARCHASGTALAHCPTSNMFLGSGLFDVANARKAQRPVRVALATDVGGGARFSMLSTMHDAYKVARLGGRSLSAAHAFYLATRGAAHALYMEDRIGSIAKGMEADVVVLDLKSTPLIEHRMRHCKDIDEALFVQMILGDERAIRVVYIAGEVGWTRDAREHNSS
jgi:guanine deaminase